MLEYLELDNVGPAPRMKIEFAPRVNIITGDNGLGKSFLLDTAWWAFAADWPAEVNRGMTTGLVARPRDRNRASTIRFRTRSADGTVDSEGTYSRGDRLEPGLPMRVSVDDARDIPSIQTSYAGRCQFCTTTLRLASGHVRRRQGGAGDIEIEKTNGRALRSAVDDPARHG